MNELILNLANRTSHIIFVFDKNGNLVFMNESAKFFLHHFGLHPISVTNYKDFRQSFPCLFENIEKFYTRLYNSNQTFYEIKFSDDYIGDVSITPFLNESRLENLSVIIMDKTVYYKKLKAEKEQTRFLKEIMSIRDLSRIEPKNLYAKTLDLIKSITKQKNILMCYGTDSVFDNYFYTGFSKSEAKKITSINLSDGNTKKLLFNEENMLKENIYFIPFNTLKKLKINFKNRPNGNMLICTIIENKGIVYGLVFVEFQDEILPYISMIEHLSLFTDFAHLIFGNFQKAKELAEQNLFIENILNTVPDSVIVCDSDLKIKFANKFSKSFFKVSNPNKVGTVKDFIGESLFSEIMDMFKKSSSVKELYYEAKDGKKRFLHIKCKKFKFTGETKYILILADITDKKELELKTIESEKISAIKSLAVTANHQINNPLAVIQTQLDGLDFLLPEEIKSSEKIEKILNNIKKQVDRISFTIAKLSSISQIVEKNYANRSDIKLIDLEASVKKLID